MIQNIQYFDRLVIAATVLQKVEANLSDLRRLVFKRINESRDKNQQDTRCL